MHFIIKKRNQIFLSDFTPREFQNYISPHSRRRLYR